MIRNMFRALTLVTVCGLFASMVPQVALAGTTGGITGRAVDSETKAPLADVTVTATSASQTATSVSDANGSFRFLSLAPDTYTVSFQKTGYDPTAQAGISVFADQVQSLNVSLTKSLKTIAKLTSRSAGNIVKPGTTSDVYSVNATAAAAAQSLVGPGGLSNAYGAIASVPGVQVDGGEAGWFQQVHIRGGDIDQVGYELDGIPVNRVYDNAPQTMLSSLGQQELQVYTGGTPASADAQGIAGYVNQVVKTGTYPGFGTANLDIGTPAFYHRAAIEAGGSTPDRNFSYYAGFAGANQGYRYLDNNNGAGSINSFFYPMNAFDPNTFAPGPSGVYVLGNSQGIPLFAPGNTYGISDTSQRDSIVNFHFAIPHKRNGLRDDVQLLYLTSEVFAQYYSSPNDIGNNLISSGALPIPAGANTLYWNDGPIYSGAMFQAADPTKVTTYYFPSSPPHAFNDLFAPATRDTNDNGVAVTKLQYQHAFSDRAFMRIYGYTLYSNWYIHGPNSADQIYGAELADYEIPDHTFGGNLSITDQLSDKHLLSGSVSYTGANLQRYSLGFVRGNPNVATLVDPQGRCYDGGTGAFALCDSSNAQLGAADLQAGLPATAGLAATNGAQWLATSGGLIANLNKVNSRFSAVSLTDEWRPDDKWVVNLGARVENFKYLLGNTNPNDPARQFWFTSYNNDHCITPGVSGATPYLGTVDAVTGATVCNAGDSTLTAAGPGYTLVNKSGGDLSTTRFEPRLSFTYTINPDTVVRGSYGVYARPQNTSWVQYDTVQEDLASFLGTHFYSYGFRSPEHDIRPDTSYNYDLSLEKRLHGTDWTFKLTPFYRSTKDQLQNFFIDPLTGLESGLNVGHQISSGVEVAVQKGDFSRDGLSGAFTFTYTHSRIKYNNFDNTNSNVIDGLNNFISQYNSYVNIPCFALATGTPYSATPGAPIANPANCTAADVANPYYGKPAQPLLDRNAYYTTYDVIPGPISAENGYETPYVSTLILNYKRARLSITPSFTFSSGAKYGAPLAWPGYSPEACTAFLPGAAATPTGTPADPASCGANPSTGLSLYIPNVYTGKFDNLGDFKQPWRFQMSLALAYEISSKVKAHVAITNLVDHCGQRGYAWDVANTCVYGSLPSGIFAPAGNFYPNANGAAPAQMKYPYTYLLNNNNTGFVGTRLPLEATFNLEIKL